MEPCSKSPLEPTPESLRHRSELGNLFSSLRRVRSRTPFFSLPAHTIPTLWGLYRGLRREAPSPEIGWRVRKVFEKNRNMTGTESTIRELRKGYKMLETFQKAKAGDAHLQSVLKRYSAMIAAKRDKENWKQVMREEWDWQQRAQRKPILTGAIIPASLDNKPIPRVWPPSNRISAIIRSRRRLREKRLKRQRTLIGLQQDLRTEAQFEENLQKELGSQVPTVFGSEGRSSWNAFFQSRLHDIDSAWERSRARARTSVSPELFAVLAAARQFRHKNKTREREKERRGVILKRTLKRARKGPPAHILATMTEREKHIDRIIRLPGEVGYVGMIKRQAGMKMKDSETWKLEESADEKALQREKYLEEENERRRRGA